MRIEGIGTTPVTLTTDLTQHPPSEGTLEGNRRTQEVQDKIAIEVKKQEKQIEKKLDREELNKVVDGMNKFLEPSHTSLRFKLHEELNEYYVAIVDDKTSEIVREIPSKKLLDTYAAMTKFLGLIVDKKI